MSGSWIVNDRNVIETNTIETEALAPGMLVAIASGGANDYVVDSVSVPGVSQSLIDQADIEAFTGFPLDWYQNEGDGSFLDFGYGWDRLRVPGGGGAMRDYVQYGVRVVALNNNLMMGYEAEVTQDFLGQPRFEWLAQIILVRL